MNALCHGRGRGILVAMILRLASILLCALSPSLATMSVCGQAFNDFRQHPHNYDTNPKRDDMSRLIARAEAGDYRFGTESGLGFLRELLADLDVPESSQILVFSKTSLQRDLIDPANPRALYFNEDTHVAWMPGGKVEIISFDADSGGRFYIETPPENDTGEITFASPGRCFGCHGGAATNFLPGPLANSNLTTRTGRRVGRVRSHDRISHAVPFSERWGGYYVTGAPITLEHLGNTFAERAGGDVRLEKALADGTLDSLEGTVDTESFPRGDSHILPLMVFDHQIEAHNLIVEARHRDRQYAHEEETFENGVTAKTRRDTEAFFDRFVRYLVFADEVSLSGHEFLASEDFREDFRANRRVGENGHSLKDFNLEDRLFENRLSYMIQSSSFLKAPRRMKNRVYDRLREILVEPDPPEGFDHFEDGERERIVSILRETQPDLPAEWGKALARE